jgi:hypothetical protein
MARSAATNYTSAGEAFEKATAASDAFEKGDVQMLAEAVDQHAHEAGRGVPVQRLRSGLFADLPADGNAGAFYLATDTDQLFFDNGLGAGWLEVAVNPIQNSDLRDSLGISVVGRAAATDGAAADIQATGADQVLRESGGVIGWGTVATAGIANSAVTNAKLGTDLDASKLTAGLLPIARIDDASVTNAKLASGIDASKLTTGLLPIARIDSGAILNVKLGTDLDASKLGAGYLPIARIQDGAITAAKLAADAVTTADTLTLPNAGWVGRGAAALRMTFNDAGNVIAISHSLSIPAGQAIYFEGYGGNTYVYYDSGTGRLNFVLNGTVVGYLSDLSANAAGQLLTLDGSGLVPLADIPTTLTGKTAAAATLAADSTLFDGQNAAHYHNATNLDAGTVAAARLPATGVDASSLTTGTLPIARIADGDVTAAKIANRTRTIFFPFSDPATDLVDNDSYYLTGQLPADYVAGSQATISYAFYNRTGGAANVTLSPSFCQVAIGGHNESLVVVSATGTDAASPGAGKLWLSTTSTVVLAASTYAAGDVFRVLYAASVTASSILWWGVYLTYTADS